MAPVHSRTENPPNSWRQNLIHSGVVGGGHPDKRTAGRTPLCHGQGLKMLLPGGHGATSHIQGTDIKRRRVQTSDVKKKG
ncbi:hypothetical protein EYF80_008136 [Liparis tanakae]|uniref:Uncharacterized protein n=1 Tax=Liparis tanakae TaxID=230148 RepID=A0A4Z2IUN2_9TELE|nr:hypothetical protein EYF80_008136 [Liparis tanakae]